jgi:hypothetical protein
MEEQKTTTTTTTTPTTTTTSTGFFDSAAMSKGLIATDPLKEKIKGSKSVVTYTKRIYTQDQIEKICDEIFEHKNDITLWLSELKLFMSDFNDGMAPTIDDLDATDGYNQGFYLAGKAGNIKGKKTLIKHVYGMIARGDKEIALDTLDAFIQAVGSHYKSFSIALKKRMPSNTFKTRLEVAKISDKRIGVLYGLIFNGHTDDHKKYKDESVKQITSRELNHGTYKSLFEYRGFDYAKVMAEMLRIEPNYDTLIDDVIILCIWGLMRGTNYSNVKITGTTSAEGLAIIYRLCTKYSIEAKLSRGRSPDSLSISRVMSAHPHVCYKIMRKYRLTKFDFPVLEEGFQFSSGAALILRNHSIRYFFYQMWHFEFSSMISPRKITRAVSKKFADLAHNSNEFNDSLRSQITGIKADLDLAKLSLDQLKETISIYGTFKDGKRMNSAIGETGEEDIIKSLQQLLSVAQAAEDAKAKKEKKKSTKTKAKKDDETTSATATSTGSGEKGDDEDDDDDEEEET